MWPWSVSCWACCFLCWALSYCTFFWFGNYSFANYISMFTGIDTPFLMNNASKAVSLAMLANLIPFYFFLNRKKIPDGKRHTDSLRPVCCAGRIVQIYMAVKIQIFLADFLFFIEMQITFAPRKGFSPMV